MTGTPQPGTVGLWCICGCGRVATQTHHAITRQTLRRQSSSPGEYKTLCADPRNHVPVHHDCHYDHHNHAPRFPIGVLPDSVFVFAASVLGPGPAYERLIRDYQGQDPRLSALLDEWEREAA